MVEISSGTNKISINVSSGGNKGLVGAANDKSEYFEKLAEQYANEAKNSKEEALNSEEKAKNWAETSREYAESAGQSVEQEVQAIQNAAQRGLSDLSEKESSINEDLDTKKSAILEDLEDAKTSSIGNIQEETATQLNNISNNGTQKINAIVQTADNSLNSIDTARNNAIKAIDDEVILRHDELKGEKGDKGDKGEQGIQGEKGEKGDKGDVSIEQLETKQNKLIAGENITIEDDVISLSDNISFNNPYSLFDSKYSDHELFNSSWLRSQGQYNSKAVYVTAYEVLQVEYNSEVEVGEAVTLPSGTQYTKQGLSVKLSTEAFTDYDFVLNTSDETFRLPIKSHLASGKLKSSAPVKGNGMSIGLTNGTDNCTLMPHNNSNMLLPPKANYGQPVGTQGISGYPAYSKTLGITTDSSKSGIIADLSNAIDEQNLYLYYYIGETVQNASLIDAGRVMETMATKEFATFAGFPSNRYIDLTLGASGSSYIAPANGYFFVDKVSGISNGNGYIQMKNPATNICFNVGVYSSPNGALRAWLPIVKGETITISYNATGANQFFRFIYAVGSESEVQ